MKDIILKEDEKLEDLQVGDLHIIQSANEYRFTSDAVLLANSVSAAGKKVCELCSGSGVISVLIAYKQHPSSITAVEIQPQLCDMSLRTVQICNMCDIINVVCADAKDVYKQLPDNYDVVVCNPPYRKCGSGETNQPRNIAIARHEIAITAGDCVYTASRLLKYGGAFYLIHQAERLSELFVICTNNGLQPKELTLITSRVNSPANLVIIKAVKGGKIGLTINPSIIIFDKDGNYTQTIKQLYGDISR